MVMLSTCSHVGLIQMPRYSAARGWPPRGISMVLRPHILCFQIEGAKQRCTSRTKSMITHIFCLRIHDMFTYILLFMLMSVHEESPANNVQQSVLLRQRFPRNHVL
ncbi:hypothetical protein BRADI_1g76195v3 [Brachypodium distachyon]|uniref:Uncharacterized protein n=1 Tax=Brachypodium distachyon TaxID=15368 RepID=A0A2K2DVF0_BRADI|nr:hypothetical protein BRADI_1g76195v3 [Brachypodium distachyon]